MEKLQKELKEIEGKINQLNAALKRNSDQQQQMIKEQMMLAGEHRSVHKRIDEEKKEQQTPKEDVNELKVMKKEIKELIVSSLEDSNICYGIVDLESFKILYASPNTYKLFDMDMEKIQEKEALVFWLKNRVHPEDKAKQEEMLFLGEIPPNRTYRIIHPTKGIRTIGVSSTDIFMYNNRECFVSVSQDITKE